MSYQYEVEKPKLFTDEGQRMLLKIRDNARDLMNVSGAATVGKMISVATGDSWMMLACVDRLVELREIRCVSREGATQDYVYVPMWSGDWK